MDKFIKYAREIIKENNPNILNAFDLMLRNGLIDELRLRKGCINHYYDQCLKNTQKNEDCVFDTSIMFDVSTSTIYNVIYKYRGVRLDFF